MSEATDAERLKLVREARDCVPLIDEFADPSRIERTILEVADALESAVAEKQTAIEAVRVSKAGTTLAVIVERDRVLAEKQAAEEERDEAIAKLGSVSNGYLRLNNQVAHLTVENADRDTLARANADVLEQNRVLRELLAEFFRKHTGNIGRIGELTKERDLLTAQCRRDAEELANRAAQKQRAEARIADIEARVKAVLPSSDSNDCVDAVADIWILLRATDDTAAKEETK